MQFRTTEKKTFDLNFRRYYHEQTRDKKILKIFGNSINMLLMESRCAFVHEKLFSIW